MSPTTFLWSDGWLLVALLQSTRDKPFASLPELIAAADRANHAIITRSELETGFSRLVPAGYAIRTGEGYAPTAASRDFWSKNSGKNKSLYKSWEKLAKFIGASEYQAGPLPETEHEEFVTKQAYAAATERYR